MSRPTVAILLMIGMAGCKHSEPRIEPFKSAEQILAEAPKIPPEQKVKFLRDRAKVMGLRWRIYCIPSRETNKTDYYQGDAQLKSVPDGALYIEDGAQDFWIGKGATSEDAAYDLYQQLQHAADFHPFHRAEPKKGDCSYQVVLDSKHANNKPCANEERP